MNKLIAHYISESKSITMWSIFVLPPLILEMIISIFICGGYISAIVYFLTRGSIISNIDLIISLYFLAAWIFSIYFFFKNGNAIAKSLVKWHIFVFQVAKKNPWKSISITCIVAMLLYFSQKPSVNTNQLNIIQARLQKSILNIESVNKWAESSTADLSLSLKNREDMRNNFSKSIAKFTVPPNLDTLPSALEEIANLTSEFYSLLSYIDSEKINTGGTSYAFEDNSSILDGNVQQIAGMEKQTQFICQQSQDKNNKCNVITNLIQDLKSKAGSSKYKLTKVKQLLEQFKDPYIESEIISPKLRSSWQIELEKRKIFDSQKADEWLKEANNSINSNEQLMELARQKNSSFKKTLTIFQGKVSFAKQEYNRISNNVKHRESKIGVINTINLDSLLATAKADKKMLIDQNIVTNSIEKLMTNLLTDINSSYYEMGNKKDILSTLKVSGYIISIQANNKTDIDYFKLITQQKIKLDNLHGNLKMLISETSDLIKSMENDSRKILFELGTLKSESADIDSRNDGFIAPIESAIFRKNFQAFVLVVIPVFILGMFIWLQSRKLMVNKINDIRNNKAVSDLIKVIEDQKEPQAAKFLAIEILYHEIPLVTKQEVALIKNKVKILSNSPLEENRIVASRLRNVALALEQRLREKEQI
jgi:hypothetical protein